MLARTLFLATRPMFFPASAVPVVVGTAWGLGGTGIDLQSFALALVGMFCLHAGANVINDVGDELNGCDRLNHERIAPFTGGSRFIQDGRLGIAAMAVWGVALLAAALVCGVVLILGKGMTILALGMVGAALALAYSLPPFALASRGLGELAVAVAFGLPVAASAWLQHGSWTPETALAAVAIGCWTAAILLVNEMPDRRADAAAGKRTLAVRLGPARTGTLYLAVNAVAALAQLGLFALAGLPWWSALPPLLLLAAAGFACARMVGGRDEQLIAIRLTLSIHLAGGLFLAAARLI